MAIERSKIIKFHFQQFLAWSSRNWLIYVTVVVVAGFVWVILQGQDKKVESFESVARIIGLSQTEDNLAATALRLQIKEHNYPLSVRLPKGQPERSSGQVKLACDKYESGNLQCKFVAYIEGP